MENICYFEHKRGNKETKHWAYCEKNAFPYISIDSYNSIYDTIFFDITNLDYNLEELCSEIKQIYKSYIDFFLIPYRDVEDCFEQYYFLYFYVKKSHSEYIAEYLFKYILSK